MLVTPLGIFTAFKLVQSANTPLPIVFMLSGIFTVVRFWQSLNVIEPRFRSPAGSVAETSSGER